ncbi:MAG: L,D-transpeptidase [Pseudomonadales bacterium]|jgi:hypothetical protein|nr:L,D-transpeptidase [Pseudomonadales bacterium]MCP5333148.1 L,D-transpeptidase [Pseudomonadales bacterium]
MFLHVSLSRQLLDLLDEHGGVQRSFAISSSARGAGELVNSQKTPRGLHRIRAKIGTGVPVGGVFVGRRYTGEIYTPKLAARFPERDWILSRILWLCGCEPGRNRFGNVDSARRYIYIHGTPDSEPMGVARSHGCIRMRNSELLWVYEQVAVGSRVLIEE